MAEFKHFVKNWCKITSDPEIIQMVTGFQIPLVDFQQQSRVPPELQFSQAEMQAADNQIEQLLLKGAIVEWILFLH